MASAQTRGVAVTGDAATQQAAATSASQPRDDASPRSCGSLSAQNSAMLSAAAPSFPFGSRALPPPPPPRRGAALRRARVSALGGGGEGEAGRILDPRATPFQILGLDATACYSAAQLKAAFRARVVSSVPLPLHYRVVNC